MSDKKQIQRGRNELTPRIDYNKLDAVRRLCSLKPPPDKPHCPDEKCLWLLDGGSCFFGRCVSPKRYEEGNNDDQRSP